MDHTNLAEMDHTNLAKMEDIDINLNLSISIDIFRTNCNVVVPDFREYMLGLSTDFLIAFLVLGLLMVGTVAVYVEELLHLYVRFPIRQRRDKIRWLLAVYPVLSGTSFVALIVPRSSSLNELVASIYVSICMCLFVAMLIDCYGGPAELLSNLNGEPVTWGLPPLCCIFFCCPKPKLTRTTLEVLQSMVLQLALVRPFMGYITAVTWADISSKDESSSVFIRTLGNYISFVYLVSTLIAMWSFAIIFRLSLAPLKEFAILPKFICIQLVLLINGLQKPIITIFVLAGMVGCDSQLTTDAVSARWYHMTVVTEMACLSLAAKWSYRQKPDRLLTSTPSVAVNLSNLAEKPDRPSSANPSIAINMSSLVEDKMRNS